jgi:hypothetical protein
MVCCFTAITSHGVRSDNRLENLREVSQQVNCQNRRKAHGVSGLLGAHPHQGRFSSSIRYGGKNHYLGIFDTAEEAHAAYLEAKRKHHEGSTL